MNAADWVILGVIVLSTVVAASDGFFHQAFGIAGLILGYLLAAWQYHRLADWLSPHVNSPWLADIAAFVCIFLAVVIVAGIAGRIVRWAMKKAGLSTFDRLLGASARDRQGCVVRGHHFDGHDGFHPGVKVAGRLAAGALFPGDWESSYMGRSFPVAGQVLRRARYGSSNACAATGACARAQGPAIANQVVLR